MKEALAVFVALILIIFASMAEAKSVRVTELNEQAIIEILKGKESDLSIEFREGDVLPMNFQAEGDLFVTPEKSTPTLVTVKKTFWIKIEPEILKISFDGQNFKNFKDALSGSIQAGANTSQNGGLANLINVAFKAYIK